MSFLFSRIPSRIPEHTESPFFLSLWAVTTFLTFLVFDDPDNLEEYY